MKSILNSFIHYFVYITMAILLVVTVYLSFAKIDVDYTTFWKILLGGSVAAMSTAILLHFEPQSYKAGIFYWLFHFLLTFGLCILLLKMFDWCEINALSIAVTFLADVFIYLFTSMMHYYSDKKHIVLMNKELKKRFNDEEK